MSKHKKVSSYRSWCLSMAGGICVVLGMTFVLVWWSDVTTVFRGISGAGLAVAGLVILFLLRR